MYIKTTLTVGFCWCDSVNGTPVLLVHYSTVIDFINVVKGSAVKVLETYLFETSKSPLLTMKIFRYFMSYNVVSRLRTKKNAWRTSKILITNSSFFVRYNIISWKTGSYSHIRRSSTTLQSWLLRGNHCGETWKVKRSIIGYVIFLVILKRCIDFIWTSPV